MSDAGAGRGETTGMPERDRPTSGGAPRSPFAASVRCPRCGSRLGAAAAAVVAQRDAQAAGRPVAVHDDAPFCGCCGLLIATES